MPQRPNNFTINTRHPLARGLVFAGLGAHAGSTRYHDSSVFGNTGTLIADAAWAVTSIGRRAISFDGTGDYINGADLASPGATMTVVSWVNFTNIASKHVVSKGTATSGTFSYLLGTGAASTVSFNVSTNGTSYVGATEASAQSAGAWRCYVGTYDGANVNLYRDGVVCATPQAQTGTVAAGSGVTLKIGNRYNDRYMLGSIADVLIYGRCLNDSEIRQLADPSNVMLSGLIQPPRRKWWPVVSGAAPTFKAAWATKRRQTIGGGVI